MFMIFLCIEWEKCLPGSYLVSGKSNIQYAHVFEYALLVICFWACALLWKNNVLDHSYFIGSIGCSLCTSIYNTLYWWAGCNLQNLFKEYIFTDDNETLNVVKGCVDTWSV